MPYFVCENPNCDTHCKCRVPVNYRRTDQEVPPEDAVPVEIDAQAELSQARFVLDDPYTPLNDDRPQQVADWVHEAVTKGGDR